MEYSVAWKWIGEEWYGRCSGRHNMVVKKVKMMHLI